jgi:metal-responsive CopG/Arc/MetJ family transcriptional regulator
MLSIKVSSQLDLEVEQRAKAQQLSKSELVRRALTAYLLQQRPDADPTSALAAVADLVGVCVGGPTDLASNPEHLAGFGKV